MGGFDEAGSGLALAVGGLNCKKITHDSEPLGSTPGPAWPAALIKVLFSSLLPLIVRTPPPA
jgi:hypothetical protein